MPKNPESGPVAPPDTSTEGPDSSAGERRGPARTSTDARAGGDGEVRPASAAGPNGAASGAAPGRTEGGASRTVGERKKQFLIAPRQPDGFSPMGFAPLSLSAIEQALRNSPDIEVIDTVGPRNIVGMLADGAAGGQGVLVARMTEQKAGVLQQQAQGRLVVERDQYLGLMDVQYQPGFTTSVIPHAGPAFTAVVQVLGRDGAPLPDAEVSLFGSMLPATAVTDASGQVTLTLFGETAASVRALYVKPRLDHWSFYQRDPDITADDINVVGLRALSDWAGLAGMPRQKTLGWGQRAMRLDQLPSTYRGQGVKIAVIDSGAATTHDELQRIRAGFDIVNKKTSPDTWNEDVLGHGTHCAGVIGGADLASGIRGFAPEAELHVCKLFPGGQVSQLIDALEYCIDKQIDVVNLSLGGAEPSEALEQQIIRARRAGIACIVAAGNSGGPVQYPASSPNVLAVGAIGKLGEFPPDSYHAQTLTADVDANGFFSASFSCFGPQIGVCGPGVAVPSSVPPNNYAAWDGTSMAAPHITGLAALVLAHHPQFQGALRMRTAERVERLFQVLRASARPVSLADPSRVGAGLPDAVVAVGLQAGADMGTGIGAAAGAIASLLGSQRGGALGNPAFGNPALGHAALGHAALGHAAFGNPYGAFAAQGLDLMGSLMGGSQAGAGAAAGLGSLLGAQQAMPHPMQQQLQQMQMQQMQQMHQMQPLHLHPLTQMGGFGRW
ncbi:S8 family serine peptidase [Massilia sp. PAMC28688]|uniref:S8 family serine peptidase n=1 Tax=Massilia sp. PAMC28688 TaxID=2861283 RepID=UPI001C636D11|nr:S8 family serine peptidase [Massilia sp. PAMC28688]QYF92507.1 S8 family serine peptidase [Massilia sp. PAMC28688]